MGESYHWRSMVAPASLLPLRASIFTSPRGPLWMQKKKLIGTLFFASILLASSSSCFLTPLWRSVVPLQQHCYGLWCFSLLHRLYDIFYHGGRVSLFIASWEGVLLARECLSPPVTCVVPTLWVMSMGFLSSSAFRKTRGLTVFLYCHPVAMQSTRDYIVYL